MPVNGMLRQSLCYAAGIFASKGVSLLMVPVFTRYLAPVDYGTLEILVSCADVGSIVLGMGMTDILFRFTGSTDDPQQQRRHGAQIGGLALICATMALLFTQALAPLLAGHLPGDVTVAQARLLGATLALTACVQVPLAWLRSEGRAGQFLMLCLGKTAAQALLVILALQNGLGVTGILAAGTITDALLGAVLLRLHASDCGLRFDFSVAPRYLRYGWPLVVSGIAAFALGSLDRWFLADAVGVAEMALYALAAKFGLATALLLKPFEMWWFPRRIRLLEQPGGAQETVRWVSCGIVLAMLLSAGVATVGPPLLTALASEPYHGAAAWVPWLALIAGVHAASNLLTVGCYIGHSPRSAMAINVFAAAVAIAAYLLLIPSQGIAGAIEATLLAHGLRLVAFHVCSQRRVRLPYPNARLIAAGTLGLCGCVLPMQVADGLLRNLLGIAAVLALLALAVGMKLLPVPVGGQRITTQNA